MKAMTYNRYGSPDVLSFSDVELPVPTTCLCTCTRPAWRPGSACWCSAPAVAWVVRRAAGSPSRCSRNGRVQHVEGGAGPVARRWLGGVDRQLRAVALSPFVGQRLRVLLSKEDREDLELLRKLTEAGAVTPALDRTFPLGELPEAIQYLRNGKVRGKVAVTI